MARQEGRWNSNLEDNFQEEITKNTLRGILMHE